MTAEPELQLMVSRRKIAATVKRLAAEIRQDYSDKHPVLVGALKGCFIFMSDLVRRLDIPLEVEFLRPGSYGHGTVSTGQITLFQELSGCIRGRHVLVVEDIVDTGLTVAFLCDYLREQGPASLKLCALIDKPSRRQTRLDIDYLGLTVPDKFIVGYGLDCNEKYRNLPDIYSVEGTEEEA